MNGGILPLLLLCATVGLALSRTQVRAAWTGFAGLVGSSVGVSFLPLPAVLNGAVFAGLWLSIIATAALTFIPRDLAGRWAMVAAINAGVWGGALASIGDLRGDLAMALPAALVFVPGQWLAERDRDLPIKIVASWMIAIASLSAFVSLTPTPGYMPDHMQ